jgi:hypothetical protein
VNRAEQGRFKRYVRIQPNGCWLWTGAGNNDGYGVFRSAAGKPKLLAHRWSYEAHLQPIPEGMQLDHKCHTEDQGCPGGSDCAHRRCVNPAHLEPVTASENTLRQRHAGRAKTHCPQGHPYEGSNLVVKKDGKRRCRACLKAHRAKASTPASA